MHQPVRFVTTRDGVHIACCTHGSGPPLVFVRGWISHLEALWEDPAFRSYFEALGRNFEVVRYDTRGQGLSDRDVPEIDLDALVRDLEAVMDELDIEKAVLYGATYGGPIAVGYSARHPERVSRLILDGTYARGSEILSPERRASIVETISKWWPEAFPMLSHLTNPDPAHHAPYRRTEWAKRMISAETAAHLYSLAFSIDVSDLLRAIAAPTLVLHRRKTPSVPFRLGRELAARVPDASFVALEGSAHNSWEGDSQAALAAIGAFLGVDLALAPAERTAERTAGPLAILFTDIEGSTSLTQELGDEKAQELIRMHDTIVRGALRSQRGSEIVHTGDGIMASFPSVSSAVDCAVAIQAALAGSGAPFGVRIGVNAGEPLSEDDDLFGVAVQTTARIAGKAVAGQILVSEVVRQLLAGKDFSFVERGRTKLKGLPGRVRLYEVQWKDSS